MNKRQMSEIGAIEATVNFWAETILQENENPLMAPEFVGRGFQYSGSARVINNDPITNSPEVIAKFKEVLTREIRKQHDMVCLQPNPYVVVGVDNDPLMNIHTALSESGAVARLPLKANTQINFKDDGTTTVELHRPYTNKPPVTIFDSTQNIAEFEKKGRTAIIDKAVDHWIQIMTNKRNSMLELQTIRHEFYLANKDKVDGKDNEAWFEAMRADPKLRHNTFHPNYGIVSPEEAAAQLDAKGFTEANIVKFGEVMRAELEVESQKRNGRMTIEIQDGYAYSPLREFMNKAGIPERFCPDRNRYEWKLDFARGTIIEDGGTIKEKTIYPEERHQAAGNDAERTGNEPWAERLTWRVAEGFTPCAGHH
jgi:hypothetical protein